MTSSALSPVSDRIDAETAATAVGGLSVALGALAVVAPSTTAAAFGVRSIDTAVPMLVRMVGVRNAVAGLRTLQADSSDRPKALQAGLALGAVDAAAVLLAARKGALSKRATVGALVVLAGIAVLGVVAADD